jgi:ribose transport system permease protein
MRWLRETFAFSEAGIIATLLALVLLFQFLNPGFLSSQNVAGMLRGMAYPGIVAVGMALCLISGVIDLSVGAVVGLASVVFGIASRDWGWMLPAAGGLAIILGLLVGLINGLVITGLKVTPFIATICSMYAVRGIASWISNGYTVYPLPEGFASLGSMQPMGISWAFLVMLAAMLTAALALGWSVWGLTVRAVGSDKESAECTEINVNAVQRSVFVITGGLSATAGVMVSLILNAGVPTAGMGWELIAIAACAIGGVSLFGYEGSMFGLFCGLLTLQVIQNGIVIVGVSPYTQTVVVGGILLAAMVIEVRRRRWMNMETF